MTSKNQGQLKARMKALAKSNSEKRAKNITPVEFNIDDKIRELKGRISQCKYDLEHNFPGNSMIVGKITSYENQIKKLEEEKKLSEKVVEMVTETDPKKQLDKAFEICGELNTPDNENETK